MRSSSTVRLSSARTFQIGQVLCYTAALIVLACSMLISPLADASQLTNKTTKQQQVSAIGDRNMEQL